MKLHDKIFTIAMVIFIACIIVLTCTPAAVAKDNGNYYALTTEVVEVDRDNDTVTCEDYNGNLWAFYGAEDWEVGDCASLLMYDNATPIIYDDEVQGARYNAWTLTR